MEELRNASNSNGEDRFSKLPDSLIHRIMSFVDTKYAVQASVLSKRWIDVWKSLPFLKFTRSSFADDRKDSFIMFVDMVFLFREDVDIQRLEMKWERSAYDASVKVNVNRWSLAAVKYNVQKFIIEIGQCHNSPYELPHRLLNCKSLRMLAMQVSGNVRYAEIILPRSMNLPQLKRLSFFGLSISNVELSRKLFLSCPALEILDLVECNIHTDNLRNLIVDSLCLKRFDYSNHRRGQLRPQNDTMDVIRLCAPNLVEFTCSSFLSLDYSLWSCSPLSRVTFDMVSTEDENAETYGNMPYTAKDMYAKRMMRFLGAVHIVKEMRLSAGFLEILSRAPGLLDCQPPCLYNLLKLRLEMWSTRGSISAVTYLLKISPNVTSIFLKLKESNSVFVGDDWEAGLSLPGMLSHLEYVQIEEVEGHDAELKLLSFLLKNANVLKEVSLYFRSTVVLPHRARQVELFKNTLRAVPTASSSIQMVFKTW